MTGNFFEIVFWLKKQSLKLGHDLTKLDEIIKKTKMFGRFQPD